MLKRFSICAALCLLAFTNAISAQTDEPDTFPVEQRCIDAPTQPPDDWTYPGMILMSGYAGIHAMQADWETPRIVAFLSRDNERNEPLIGGQLSPDQNWYAVPMGEVFTEISYNVYHFVQGLRLYSLSGNGKALDFDLNDYQDIYIYFDRAWTYLPIQWRDNESLIIGGIVLYPFTESAEANLFQLEVVGGAPIFSPDLTHVFGSGLTYGEDFVSYSGLYDPFDPESFQVSLSDIDTVFWKPDSSGFMTYTRRGDSPSFAYYNRDGELLWHVLALDLANIAFVPHASGRTDLQWSPNNSNFAITVSDSNPPYRKLYIADIETHVAIDTCLEAETPPVWSPDGTMFAYLANASENLNLIVVDTITWQAYIVARHSGARGRFGEPEMVGWRSTTNEQ